MGIALAKQIFVLFFMMGGGFALVKLKILPASGSSIISKLTIYLVMPCVLINSFQVKLTAETRSGFLLCIFAALLIHGILFLSMAILNRIFHFTPIEKTTIMYSNSGNLIIPLITALLGSEWVLYASAFLCVQLFFIWSHCRSVIEGEAHIDIKKILTNINIIAIFIGLFFLITGIQLPSVIEDTMTSLSSTVGPLSMIMIGMILAEVKWKDYIYSKRFYLVVFMKMIFVPVLIMLFLKFSLLMSMHPQGQTLLFLSLLAVSTPGAAAVVQIAQLYDKDTKYASALNSATALISLITMPLVVSLYYM
jgi:malate permease and related proteins